MKRHRRQRPAAKETIIVKNLRMALTAIGMLWLVYAANGFLTADLRAYGIHPRRIEGLLGIVFCPFLHANMAHLAANSSALFILLAVSLSYSRKLTVFACTVIVLIGGGLVWVFGRPDSVHVGASGVIFGLIGFLMCLGFFRREWKAMVFSVAVFLLYGGALFQLLVYVPGISWSGHFFGFLSGALAAWWTRNGQR